MTCTPARRVVVLPNLEWDSKNSEELPGLLRYPHVFSPLRVGRLTVRNRILQSAHSKNYAESGLNTSRELDYQRVRAEGGVGLIITGLRPVHPSTSVRRVP